MTRDRSRQRTWGWDLSRWGTKRRKYGCEVDCKSKGVEVGKGMMPQSTSRMLPCLDRGCVLGLLINRVSWLGWNQLPGDMKSLDE